MQNMAISFSICVSNQPRRLNNLIAVLSEDFKVRRDDQLELLTVRHYKKEVLSSLLKGKIVVFEERIRETVQMVVRDVPVMRRKRLDVDAEK